MKRRGNPEAEIQRDIVEGLRLVLPHPAVVHHSAHERRGSDPRSRLAQAIAVGMGVHPGFADLIVIASCRVVFLEVKTARGRMSADQEAFRDAVETNGFGYAVVRSFEEALAAVEQVGIRTRVVRAGNGGRP